MKMTLTTVVALLTAALCVPLAFASNQRNDIISCYDYAKVPEHRIDQPETELFILVDQTVRLDVPLKKMVHQQIPNFAKPGNKVTVVTFSALAAGQYTNITFEGKFDHLMPTSVRNSLGRQHLQSFDNCLKKQAQAINMLNVKLKNSFNDGEQSFPKTELVGSLLSVSTEVVAQSTAKRKILLVVSDMLENSETLSFYSKGRVRTLDAEQAYAKIQSAGFSGDLAGMDVYVVGAGFIHGAKNYSSQKSVNELERFWRKVITENNGKVVQFGKPQLLNNIR
ncbi:hypothetical protein ACWU4D_02255 [Vibrio sp. WJH972]